MSTKNMGIAEGMQSSAFNKVYLMRDKALKQAALKQNALAIDAECVNDADSYHRYSSKL